MPATTTTTTTTKGATMVAIRGALPAYFTLSVASVIKALQDKSEHHAMLARALTGAAIERAQSGNVPALAGADSALESIKGKSARQRIDNALSHVRAIKARAMASASVGEYETFANETYSHIISLLTPPAPVAKPKAAPVNWRARAEAAEAAHAVLLAYAEALRTTIGATAPALPIGATLAAAPADTEESLL